MSAYKSDFLDVLASRGFIHQLSDAAGLDARAAQGAITAYVGFDATAPSLHIGNLLSIMMLRWLQKTGHRPIVLMGGGTSKIGDPSGKDTSRTLLTDEQIDANIAKIRTVFARFLDFDAGTITANNADWLDQLRYIPLLRDVGRHFTVNRMLTFDSVKLRLDREQPLTFLEFNYMILQAYDFVELYKRHGCILQMGGSDQWGNIVNGIELGRRLLEAELFALTTPLLTTSSGREDGQDRKRRGLAQCRDDAALRLLAVLAQQRGRRRRAPHEAVHRIAARRRSAGWARSRVTSSTKPRRCWRPRPPRSCTAAPPPPRPPRPRGGRSRKARLSESLPTIEIARAELESGLGVLVAFVRGRPGRVERRGTAPDQGWRPQGQRRCRSPTRRWCSRGAIARRKA